MDRIDQDLLEGLQPGYWGTGCTPAGRLQGRNSPEWACAQSWTKQGRVA